MASFRSWIIFATLATAPWAAAQTTQPASLPADQMLREMLSPSSDQPVATEKKHPATQPAVTGLIQPLAPASGRANLLREGSDVLERRGTLHKRDDSPFMEFVFENASGQHLEPMLVLPNRALMAMENATSAVQGERFFTVSGTVTEYDNKNYILLYSGPDDAVRRVMSASAVLPTSRASADQLLTAMLASEGKGTSAAEKSAPPTMDKTTGSGAVAPGAPAMNVLPENSQVIDRIARLSRTADGRQAQLSFESDGAAMQDPPVIILPNLKLAAMETAAIAAARDTRFRCTGVITEYRGRNYILLEKVVVVPPGAQQL